MQSYRLSDLDPLTLERLCLRNPVADPARLEDCRVIFEEISRLGDEGVRKYTEKFDGVRLADFQAVPAEFSRARQSVPQHVVQALERAARNIGKFHSSQLGREDRVEVQPGVVCWRESRPIRSVGLYVPGGRAVLPSTVLMLGIPARLAGCQEVVLCVPPWRDGEIFAALLVAAEIAGIEKVYKIGGVQAIAAMAVGTETVPRVEKILGPGNPWVQAAKLFASLKGVAIDMFAGPSEVLVMADDSAVSDWVAADLVSQAEHGADSLAILVSSSPRVAEEVVSEVWRRIEDLPRKEWAAGALRESFSLLVEDLEQGFEFSNQYAPEHLILHVGSPQQWLPKVESAGSVFLGSWSPEVAGDYASGTNHTLPTSGMARGFSGVSIDSFVKKITFQELTKDGFRDLAPTLETLAELEGLEGHRRAVEVRLRTLTTGN